MGTHMTSVSRQSKWYAVPWSSVELAMSFSLLVLHSNSFPGDLSVCLQHKYLLKLIQHLTPKGDLNVLMRFSLYYILHFQAPLQEHSHRGECHCHGSGGGFYIGQVLLKTVLMFFIFHIVYSSLHL